jgi:hypothetical protein
MSSLITITGQELVRSSATQQALERRDALLAKARQGVVVQNPDTAQGAASLLIEIKEFTRQIEDSRREAKGPVLEQGRKIDALADHLTKALDVEAEQISRVLGEFQQQQKKREEEERQAAWEKEQAIIREANRVAQEKKRAFEAQREELREKEENARTEEGRELARIMAIEAEQIAQCEAHAHQEQVEAAIIAARVSAITVPKPEGIATSFEVIFEVEDITALYESNPAFVVLTPQRAAIKNALKTLREGQRLPGVKHWKVAKTVVR